MTAAVAPRSCPLSRIVGTGRGTASSEMETRSVKGRAKLAPSGRSCPSAVSEMPGAAVSVVTVTEAWPVRPSASVAEAVSVFGPDCRATSFARNVPSASSASVWPATVTWPFAVAEGPPTTAPATSIFFRFVLDPSAGSRIAICGPDDRTVTCRVALAVRPVASEAIATISAGTSGGRTRSGSDQAAPVSVAARPFTVTDVTDTLAVPVTATVGPGRTARSAGVTMSTPGPGVRSTLKDALADDERPKVSLAVAESV